MNKILKYELPMPSDPRTTEMPEGAQVLSVAEQDGRAFVWALVEPLKPKVQRRLFTSMTGTILPLRLPPEVGPLYPHPDKATFVGTIHYTMERFVLHVFDLGEVE